MAMSHLWPMRPSGMWLATSACICSAAAGASLAMPAGQQGTALGRRAQRNGRGAGWGRTGWGKPCGQGWAARSGAQRGWCCHQGPPPTCSALDRPGRNAVHAHTVGTPLQRQAACDAVHCRLGCRRMSLVPRGTILQCGTDVDDAGSIALAQLGEGGAAPGGKGSRAVGHWAIARQSSGRDTSRICHCPILTGSWRMCPAAGGEAGQQDRLWRSSHNAFAQLQHQSNTHRINLHHSAKAVGAKLLRRRQKVARGAVDQDI